jgi:hypothetical protein
MLLLPERIARPVQVDYPSVGERVGQHCVGLATDKARLPGAEEKRSSTAPETTFAEGQPRPEA